MNEIQMRVCSMFSTRKREDMYVLVLEEVNGDNKMPVIVDSSEAQYLKEIMLGQKVSRPLTHDLLLEVIRKLGGVLKKVLVYKVKDGVSYSYICLEKGDEKIEIDARTSDAIALALRYRCAIYMDESILNTEYVHQTGETNFAVNVNLVDTKLLEEALSQAVEEENYERAGQLHDEIKRREQERNKSV